MRLATFSFEGLLPRANVLLRSHWSLRRKLKADLVGGLTLLRNDLTSEGKFRCAEKNERRNVYVTLKKHRLSDPDNAVSQCKSLIDAMIATGLIYDDGPRFLHLEVKQEKIPKGEKPTVVISVSW